MSTILQRHNTDCHDVLYGGGAAAAAALSHSFASLRLYAAAASLTPPPTTTAAPLLLKALLTEARQSTLYHHDIEIRFYRVIATKSSCPSKKIQSLSVQQCNCPRVLFIQISIAAKQSTLECVPKIARSCSMTHVKTRNFRNLDFLEKDNQMEY